MFSRKSVVKFAKAVGSYLKGLVLYRLVPLGVIILIVYGLFLWQESRNVEDDGVQAAITLAALEAEFLNASGLDSATLSNDQVTVHINSQNLAMTITNNTTGFVWSHEVYDEDMNPMWQSFAAAGITIEAHFNSQFNRQYSFEGRGILSYSGSDTVLADVFFEEAGIAFQVEYRLIGDTVSVTVLWDSIIEADRRYELQTITLYPFLGASRGLHDGFIFVPDGVGALIDLSYQTRARSPFSAVVFGEDLGFYGNSVNVRRADLHPPHTVRVPVFGIGYDDMGGNALMSFISQGAEHVEINAYASGVVTPYNWAAATFRYRDLHMMALLATGSQMNQEIPNEIDIQINFTVLNGQDAGFDGMARRLQQKLVADGILTPLQNPVGDMFATVLVADNENALIGRRELVMSTPEQVGEMAETLSNLSPNGLRMEVFGFQNGGLTGQSPRLTGMVGSDAAWRNLINNFDGYLFFRRDYKRVYNGASGVRSWNLAQNISEEVIGMHNDQIRSMSLIGLDAPNYQYFRFLNPATSMRMFERDLSRFNNLGITNISFDTMAQMLTSIHGRHRHTRTEMIEFYRNLLSQGVNEGLTYAFHNPNMYLWDKSDIMLDLPITSSGFTVLSRSVPFMPILLSGHQELFATYANFEVSSVNYLLRLVEFGMRPSYLLTWECPTVLFDADTNWISSSQFSVWQAQIEENAAFLANAIAATNDAAFVSHHRLVYGVYESVYSNGASIIVNHTSEDFTIPDGVVVPSRNYIVSIVR